MRGFARSRASWRAARSVASPASPAFAATGCCCFAAFASCAAGSGIAPVPLHGDFKPANLIWTEAGVYGIDASIRNVNPGAMDIAQYLSDLLLTLRRYPAHATTLDRLLDVFLAAYGDSSEAQRRAVMWWMSYSVLAAVAGKRRRFGRGAALDPKFGGALGALANPSRAAAW